MSGNKVNVYSRAVELESLNSKAQSLFKDIQLQDFTITEHLADVKHYGIKSNILTIKKKREEDGELMLTYDEKIKLFGDICRRNDEKAKSCKEVWLSSEKMAKLSKKYAAVEREMRIKIEEIKEERYCPVATTELTMEEKRFIHEGVSTAERIFRKYKQNSNSELQLELERYQKKLQRKGL